MFRTNAPTWESLMIWLRTIAGVRTHFPERWTEWLMVVPALGIGFALQVQPDMFDHAVHYDGLRRWAEESTWEAVILTSAVFRLLALFINGTFDWFRWTPHLRFLGAFAGGAIWSQFSLSALVMYFEAGSSLGPVMSYGTLAIVEGVNVFRSSRAVGRWAKGAS